MILNGGTGLKVFVRLVSVQGTPVCLVAGTLCKGQRVRDTVAHLENFRLLLMAAAYIRRDGASL